MSIFTVMKIQNQPICDTDKRLYNVMVDRYKRKLVSLSQAVIMLSDVVTDREYFEEIGKNEFLRMVAKS
jgi:hypothetical protein